MFPTAAILCLGICVTDNINPMKNANGIQKPMPQKNPLEKINAKDKQLKELDKRTLEILAKERASGNPRNVHATIKALDKLVATMKQSKFEDQEILKAFEEELAAWILLGKE